MIQTKSVVEQHKLFKEQIYDIIENRPHHVVDSFISVIAAMNARSDEAVIEFAAMVSERKVKARL